MSFDFSQEEAQSEYVPVGPVPGGSIVYVRMNLLEATEKNRLPNNPYVRVSQYGLRQLYASFEVTRGRYAGAAWRQTITLPHGMQNSALDLTEGQQTACRIGGATLKAILQASGKSLNIPGLAVFNGLVFPVKVRISSYAGTSKNGDTIFRNEISQVITPDKPDYAEMRQLGEIINEDGPVTAKPKNNSGSSGYSSGYSSGAYGSESASYSPTVDDVPF